MYDFQYKLNSLGLEIPSILLPKPENLKKWPVIACDQFTQDRNYWEKAKSFVGGAPSTLNLIFPEVFLPDNDAARRITDIHSLMKRYLQVGVFTPPVRGFIYIERDTPYNKKRRGLVAAIDLEKYDWHPDARPLIRCTEGTVPERLPPRMDIRRGAPLELPHALLLIDDDKDVILPSIGESVKNNDPCYSTPLMMNSGSVTGWFIDAALHEEIFSALTEQLDGLFMRSTSRYDNGAAASDCAENFAAGRDPFLFAVGDGNHSLAAAKGIWEEHKAKNPNLRFGEHRTENSGEYDNSLYPCRYALVEIENIYDQAIQFEPIHRVVFDIGFDAALSLLSKLPDFSMRSVNSGEELAGLVRSCFDGKPAASCNEVSCAANCFGVISDGRYALIETSAAGISTAGLQPLLDAYAGNKPQLIDYIHDEKELFRLAAGKKGRQVTGILLPPVRKSGLFETVARYGPLPRKSFSMGHSCEKRFYLEGRALF